MKKLCIIIGVGPGMGLSLAKRFGSEGFTIALAARKKEALDGYVKELAEQGIESAGYPTDVSDFGSLSNTMDSIKKDHGDATVLIYNVSVLNPGKPTEIDPEALVRDFRINTAGALVAAQAAKPQMEGNEGSAIFITGGGLALSPFQEYASLGVGKAALRNLSHSIAQEFKSYGIRVSTVIINGMIQKGTHFDPDTIAGEFWKLYSGPAEEFDKEVIYN